MEKPTLRHPSWCTSRELCEFRGAHLSRVVELRNASGDQATIRVQMGQSFVGQPFFVLDNSESYVPFAIDQARALTFVLRALVAQAVAR